MPLITSRIGLPDLPTPSCEEIRDVGEFVASGCADRGNLYLGKFELGTVYLLIFGAVLILVAPALYWYRWRRIVKEGSTESSVADLLNQFETPDATDDLWSRCLVAERGDEKRAKYAYVEAVAAEREKQDSISVGKRGAFIAMQLILTAISFGIFRDLVGSGQYFISSVGGLAILYFATSK